MSENALYRFLEIPEIQWTEGMPTSEVVREVNLRLQQMQEVLNYSLEQIIDDLQILARLALTREGYITYRNNTTYTLLQANFSGSIVSGGFRHVEVNSVDVDLRINGVQVTTTPPMPITADETQLWNFTATGNNTFVSGDVIEIFTSGGQNNNNLFWRLTADAPELRGLSV